MKGKRIYQKDLENYIDKKVIAIYINCDNDKEEILAKIMLGSFIDCTGECRNDSIESHYALRFEQAQNNNMITWDSSIDKLDTYKHCELYEYIEDTKELEQTITLNEETKTTTYEYDGNYSILEVFEFPVGTKFLIAATSSTVTICEKSNCKVLINDYTDKECILSSLWIAQKFTLIKPKEYITFNEARRSGKKFKYKDWDKFYELSSVLGRLIQINGDCTRINQLLDEKAWEMNR